MKEIVFSRHALIRIDQREAFEEEVKEVLLSGERFEARDGRIGFRKNFQCCRDAGKKIYHTKQLAVIVVEEELRYIIVTVLVFWF